MQETRVTGGLSQQSVRCEVYRGTVPDSYPTLSSAWVRTVTRVGYEKSITSERSGQFHPGQLRLNPTTIKTGQGFYVPSAAYSGRWNGYYYRLLGGSSCYDNSATPSYFDWGAWRTDLESLSFLRSKAKLKDAELEAAVMLGELKETLSMLKNPAKALTDEMFKFYRHGWKRVRKGTSLMDALTGSWLTYRYGIIPLMSDIQAILKMYHNKFVQIQGLSRQKAGISDETVKTSDYVGTPGGGFTNKVHWKKVVKVKSTTHIYYQKLMEADSLYQARLYGFHPTQLPSAAWELVTLSFVVDWFLAIGDWLRAITPDWNAKHLGNCTSQKITVRIISEDLAMSHPSGLLTDHPVSLGYYSWESDMLIRKVGTATPLFPVFMPNPFNLKREADSLALLWGRIIKPLIVARR